MKKIPFIKYSKLWFTISSLTVVVALALLLIWGLKFGIDFTGGSLMELSFTQNRPTTEQVQGALKTAGLTDTVVQMSGTNEVIVRTTFLSESEHEALLTVMRNSFNATTSSMREVSLQTVGGTVSQDLRQRAIYAIIWVNIAIIIYVAYAFRKVSRPVASWKYGGLAIVALCHDILVVLGAFALFGHFFNIQIETDFVLALLTVLGFSVTDTIVVYDRIRENVMHHSAENFGEIVNVALNETLMRSINTTLTVLLPLVALFFLGGESIHDFALALIIGMASGAYSSIFIASPLLVAVERWQRRRKV